MTTVSVIIPSRLKRASGINADSLYLERAVESVRAQTIANDVDIKIIVGIDAGEKFPAHLIEKLRIQVAESTGNSQAAALNAAVKLIDGDHVAFLEDDDQWDPQFLAVSLRFLNDVDFVSSNQLEVTEKGKFVRINYFPTPSGWTMRRETWCKVGEFNEEYRFHLDNEWLGRLFEQSLTRVHLIDAASPEDPQVIIEKLSGLAAMLRHSNQTMNIIRHNHPLPLVRRLIHSSSGTAQIAINPALKSRSDEERAMLKRIYG